MIIRTGQLDDPQVIALLAVHARGMLDNSPPDVGALRGPLGPMFRCPFPSMPDEFGHRNMGTGAVCGRFRSP